MHLKAFVACVSLALVVGALAAEEKSWPEFRGPTGQGRSVATGLPLAFSETEKVVWKTAIPGEGWSSPVVMDGRIWMTTATDKGTSLRAVCVDFESGKVLVDREVFAVENPEGKHTLNSYASPTPVLEQGRVYLSFGDYGNAALNSESGDVVWKNRLLRLDHENGPGSSPILFNDKFILHCDGTNVQYMAALKKSTGGIAWKVDRSGKIDKAPPMKKAYTTPLVIDVNGRKELISPAAEHVYGYDPDTGKELWVVKYPGFSNVPRPIYAHGLLYIGTGFGKPEMWAIKPGGSGDVTKTHVVWKVLKGAPAKPSPIVVDDLLYMISDNGIVTAVEALTGNQVWQERLGGEHSASPLHADGRLYFFSHEGVCKILQPGREFKVIAEAKFESGFMASPAVYGKSLVLRSKTHLFRVEERGQAAR